MSKRSREESISSDGDAFAIANPPRSASVESDGHTPKYIQVEGAEPHALAMRCLLPPHKALTFASYADYETHYQQAHVNRCEECKRNLPSAHFLDLHIAENHDPIVAAKRDHGERTYACFVEGCEKVCGEWRKRRSHLIDKHGFPKNYDFLIVNSGIDKKRSMLRPGVDAQGHRKSSRERSDSSTTEMTQTTAATSVSERSTAENERTEGIENDTKFPEMATDASVTRKPNDTVEQLTTSMSSLQMVPRSITFGKRKGRAGFAKS